MCFEKQEATQTNTTNIALDTYNKVPGDNSCLGSHSRHALVGGRYDVGRALVHTCSDNLTCVHRGMRNHISNSPGLRGKAVRTR